jgi:hypothetical protein
MGRQAGKWALICQILGKSLKPKVESLFTIIFEGFSFQLLPFGFQPACKLVISKCLKINLL